MVKDLSDPRRIRRRELDQVRRQQSRTRAQSTSVDRGAFRIKSVEGLEVGTAEDPTGSAIVYGALTIVGQLNGDGTITWTGVLNQIGPTNLRGPVAITGETGTLDVAADATFSGNVLIDEPGQLQVGDSVAIDPAHSPGGSIKFDRPPSSTSGAEVFGGDFGTYKELQLLAGTTGLTIKQDGTESVVTVLNGFRLPFIGAPPETATGLKYLVADSTGRVYLASSAGDGGGDTPPQLNPEGYIWPADPAIYGISDTYADHLARNSAEPGVDVKTPVGAACYAPADGTIAAVHTSTSGATGRYVTVRTAGDAWFRLLHLSEVLVAAGDPVTQGQIVGRTGGSGFGSESYYGPHVHITFWSGPSTTQPSFDTTEDFQAYMAAQG